MTAVTTIRNLGSAMERSFAVCGLTTAEQIRDIGADAAYSQLLASGQRPHFAAFIALAMGLQDRDWLDPDPQEKAELRARFEALKATQTNAPSGIEAELDKIGVRSG